MRWQSLVGVVVLLAFGGWGARSLVPSRGAGAGDGAPSRAILVEHVRRLAEAPRPLGTEAHDRARDYIIGELHRMGLAPEVQRTTALAGDAPLVHVADVENVVVRIAGVRDAPAVLVASHYDSVPSSPGAADDAAGVACLLEVARLLRAEPPSGPVVLLFSDGEERGLLGARAFVAEHPWAREIGAAINLEARGSGGRPVLIELNGAAPRLVQLLAASGAPVRIASYVTDAYRRSGHDTDFSVFRRSGWPGYNLAFFGDPASYHTALDTVERLDPATLSEQATAAHRLTRALASSRMALLRDQADASYASAPGGFVIVVPRDWTLPLALVALLACGMLAVVGRRRARPRRVGVALAVLLGGCAASVLVAAIVPVLLGALVAAATLAASVAALIARRCERAELMLAVASLLALLGVAVTVMLPSASLLVVLPALAAVGGTAVELRWRRAVAFVILAAPTMLLWGEAIAILAIGLGERAKMIVALLGALAALVPAVAARDVLATLRRRAAIAYVIPTIAYVIIATRTGASPIADHLVLAVDTESRTARWVTFDREVDRWTSLAIVRPVADDLGAFFGGRPTPVLAAPAVVTDREVSQVVHSRGDTRALELRLEPSPGAATVRLDIYTGAPVIGAAIAGRALPIRAAFDPRVASLSILYFQPSATGTALTLELAQPGEVTVVAVDIHQGALRDLVASRPPDVIPGTRWPTDAVLVRGVFRFPLPVGGVP